MLELEKFAETRMRQDGQEGERTTGNLVVASISTPKTNQA